MFRPFVFELQRRGLPFKSILAANGIDGDCLLEGEHYLSVRSWYDFAEACAEETQDKYFGLRIGYDEDLLIQDESRFFGSSLSRERR